jgi:hypothetical protein
MEEKRISEHSQDCVITFELIAEENEFDPALIDTVGHVTVAALEQEGYTTEPPVYTGQKGIERFFIELVTTVQQIATFVEGNHAAIAEDIADISGLVTIFGGIVPVLKRLREAHEKQVGKTESTIYPIKMTTDVDGAQLVIEMSDIEQADAAFKLAMKYHSAYPAKAMQVSTKSKAKVQGRVPARKRRPRR